MEEKTKIINWELIFFTPQKMSAVKRVEFVSDRMSYRPIDL
jgi:hypothetical protein